MAACFAAVYKDFLILRLGEDRCGEALKLSFAKPFDITGRPMKGWVMVKSEGIGTDDNLESWLKQARDFVKTLGPKEKG